jgi:hypothetical protein
MFLDRASIEPQGVILGALQKHGNQPPANRSPNRIKCVTIGKSRDEIWIRPLRMET